MEVSQIALTILTSIITGGFVLVFVEIGNRKNREDDRHDQIMYPFMHKLSAYFRFISWCSHNVIYSKPPIGYEKEIKTLIDEMAKYGGMAITSGGDYGINHFNAEELNQIALDINNIWYWHDKMHPCKMTWNASMHNSEFIDKELREISPVYLQKKKDIDLIAKVSGDFYVEVYQPIEVKTYNHEAYQEHYALQTKTIAAFACFVLAILSLLLFGVQTVWLLRTATLVVILMLGCSLMMLGVDEKKQIQWLYKISEQMKKNIPSKENKEKGKTVRSLMGKVSDFILSKMIVIGLMLSAWAIFSIEIEWIPKIQCGMSEATAAGFNKVYLALAYSYIAGALIYWFTVRFPYLRNKRRLKPVIDDKIQSIGNHLLNMNLEFRSIPNPQDLEITDVDAIMSMFTTARWTEKCLMPIHSMKSNVTEAFIDDYYELCRMIGALINDYRAYLSTEQLILLEEIRGTQINFFHSVSKNTGYNFSEYFYNGVMQPAYRSMLENFNKLYR